MTRAPSLVPLLAKEARALLPLWAGTMVALAAAFAFRRSPSDIGAIGYVAGVVAIGAHSIGHEYGHRTLPMLLAQPVPRRRLFAAKFLIVGAMLATLAATAAVVFGFDGFRGNDAPRMVVLPILAALFTAPLFAMICRSTLAGAVLGPSAPMTVWVVTLVVAWWAFEVDADTVADWFLDRWVLVAAIACPPLALLTWQAFNRLETIDGTPATLTLPRWMSARAGARRAAPWRALVVKEIHLQQMTIAITLLYGVMWVVGAAVRRSMPLGPTLPLEAVLLLYCMGLTIVIGALASAEERQQGTLDLQLLQPVAASRQWAIKCAVALGLALVLGVLMPAWLISMVSPAGGSNSMRDGLAANITLLVVLLTASSLYISSLTSSGVRAMAWAVPVSIGTALFIQTTQRAIAQVSARLGTPLPVEQTEASIIAVRVLPVLMVPVLLWFGFVNHTSAEHPWRRTLTQIGVMAMLIVSGILAAGALS